MLLLSLPHLTPNLRLAYVPNPVGICWLYWSPAFRLTSWIGPILGSLFCVHCNHLGFSNSSTIEIRACQVLFLKRCEPGRLLFRTRNLEWNSTDGKVCWYRLVALRFAPFSLIEMTEMYSGLHVGQRFASLEDFKALVRSISVRQHWELRVTRSNKKSVVIGCRSSPNCFFRVVCRANRNATYISSLQDSHSCRRNATSTTKTPARSEASHVRFLLSEIPKLFDMRNKIKAQDIVDAVKRYHGYDISTRQAQRALIRLQQRGSQQQSDAANSSSGEDRQESQPPPVEGQSEGSAYAGIPGQRWMPESVPPNLVDNPQSQNEDPPNPTFSATPLQAQPIQQHPQQLQNPQRIQSTVQTQQPLPPPTPVLQAPAVPQHEPTSLNHPLHAQPTSQQPSYSLPTPIQPTPRQTGLTKSPTQTQQPTQGHPSAPQLVLTNFKIEFSCTTCGALNQSFFPNQGNVTGGHYIPPHPIPEHASIPHGAGPSAPTAAAQAIVENANGRLNEAHRYDSTRRASTRGAPSAWAPTGPMDVPLAPAHTHNSPT